MKRLLIYSILFFYSSFCFSQIVIGKITDVISGEGLPGATVKVKGTNLATASEGDGTFTLNVKSFPLTLQFFYIGYETKDVRLTKVPEKPLKIGLKEKEMDFTEIEVKSSRITEKEKESPITVESMGSKQIK